MKPTTSCLASFVFIWKNKAEDKLKIYEKQGNRRMITEKHDSNISERL